MVPFVLLRTNTVYTEVMILLTTRIVLFAFLVFHYFPLYSADVYKVYREGGDYSVGLVIDVRMSDGQLVYAIGDKEASTFAGLQDTIDKSYRELGNKCANVYLVRVKDVNVALKKVRVPLTIKKGPCYFGGFIDRLGYHNSDFGREYDYISDEHSVVPMVTVKKEMFDYSKLGKIRQTVYENPKNKRRELCVLLPRGMKEKELHEYIWKNRGEIKIPVDKEIHHLVFFDRVNNSQCDAMGAVMPAKLWSASIKKKKMSSKIKKYLSWQGPVQMPNAVLESSP